MRSVAGRLWGVSEARLLELRNNLVRAGDIHLARSDVVPATDDLLPADLNERHGLRVAGLETDGCAGCDVEAVAVRLDAVELELRVRLDEVIMRTDLLASAGSRLTIWLIELPVLACHPCS